MSMRRIGRPAFLLLASLIVGAGLLVMKGQDRPVGETLPLEISAKSLDFGDVWSQRDFHWTIPVRNRSSHDVVVTDVHVSCKCTRVLPTSFKIAPGGRANISFTIDLTSNNTVPAGTLRDFTLDFAVATDARQLPALHGVLTGRIKNYLSLTPPALEFDEEDYIVEEERYRAKQIALASAEPLESIALSVQPPMLEVSSQFNGTYGTVSLRPKDDVPSGVFNAVVSISGMPATGEPRASESVAVSGNIQRDVLVSPTQLSFGPASTGSYLHATVLLKSRTGAPLHIESINVLNPSISIQRLHMPSIRGEALSFGCRITKPGVDTSVVEILVRRSVDVKERLRIPVSIVGVSNVVTAKQSR